MNTFKALIATTAIILPISAFAVDAEKPVTPQPPAEATEMIKNCPQAERMGVMQKDMDKMIQEMQSIIGQTKDKAAKERMQKLYDNMESMNKNMQEMHQNMGMMGKGYMHGKSVEETAPTKK